MTKIYIILLNPKCFYSSSFQLTITFSGGFLLSKDSPKGSEYPKTAIYGLIMPHFGA